MRRKRRPGRARVNLLQISPVSAIELVRHELREWLFDCSAVLHISTLFFSDMTAAFFHCDHSLSLNCSCNHFSVTLVAVADKIASKGYSTMILVALL